MALQKLGSIYGIKIVLEIPPLVCFSEIFALFCSFRDMGQEVFPESLLVRTSVEGTDYVWSRKQIQLK